MKERRSTPWRFIVLILGSCSILALSPAHSSTPVNHWHVFAPANHSPAFYWPSSVGIDRQGNVDVLDRGNNRIVQLSPAGHMIRQWGGRGSGPGKIGPASPNRFFDDFVGPLGAGNLVTDRQSNVYVADTWNHRIEKFSSSGVLLATWTRQGSLPVSVALGPHGTIFVSDQGMNQIIKLSGRGKVLASWGNLTVDQYDGLSPYALTVGADGTVYVVLSGGFGGCDQGVCWDGFVSYLQAYSPTGQPGVTLASAVCPTPGGVPTCALAVDRRGNILLASASQFNVLRYTQSGKQLTAWSGRRGTYLLEGTNGLALDARGNLYTTRGLANELDELSPHGKLMASWGIAGSHAGQFSAPEGLAVNAHGTVAILDGGNQRIQELSTTGRALTAWHARLDLTDSDNPSAIAVDEQGNVYRIAHSTVATCDTSGCFSPGTIVKSSPTGRILARWRPRMTPFFSPVGLTIGPHGALYTVDGYHRVVELSSSGHMLAHWTTASNTAVTGGIAVDRSGQIYVSEQSPPGSLGMRIEVFVNGKRRAMWRHLPDLGGLATGPAGTLVATEPGRDRIVEFSSAGRTLAHWGSAGSRAGQFHVPAGIAIDPSGNVYVSDRGNDRIQRMTLKSPQ